MAWTASIVQKGIVDKSFLVGVSYSNGTFQFVESINLTGGSVQTLSDVVTARLGALATTESLIPQILVGAFTPQPSSAQTPIQVFQNNLKQLRNAKELVDLGVITTLHTSYVNALNAVTLTFDPSFIGQF